jgi:hypothetical protein
MASKAATELTAAINRNNSLWDFPSNMDAKGGPAATPINRLLLDTPNEMLHYN